MTDGQSGTAQWPAPQTPSVDASSSAIDQDVIIRAVQDFGAECSQYLLREDDYTRRFASVLSRHFSGEIMMAMGGLTNQMQLYWGEHSHRLKNQYLPMAQDLYPDITLLQPVCDRHPLDLTRFETLHTDSRVLALFECKYTRSFPSATRRHFLQDTAKLEILGDYCQRRFGVLPLLMQLIFIFETSGARERFRTLYADETIRADMPHVQVVIVDATGQREALTWT